MIKLAILHFSPLELYPPLQNILIELEKREESFEVMVLTTSSINDLSVFRMRPSKIKIVRLGRSGKEASMMARLLNYLYFYSACMVKLLIYQPRRILYFETLSSLPVYLYQKFIKPGVGVLIHYHEYTSKDEYRSGMKLTSFFHKCEKWLLPKAEWVSHTNAQRMEKFKADLAPVQIRHPFIMPNYPPRHWFTDPKASLKLPLRIVYVGSIGMESTYIREFANWVVAQEGNVHWDIYSFNCTEGTQRFLSSLRSEFVKLKKGVDYEKLPAVLRGYDVGVILYNGHIPNYVYNAPNKLFEYLAAGLAVWFPSVMVGSLPYCTAGTYPEVIPFDFTGLDQIDLSEIIRRTNLKKKLPSFFCEEAVKPLIDKMLVQ